MDKKVNNLRKSSNQIKYAALISYMAVFINIVTGILYTPWMIKQIGKADYGLYSLAMSIIVFFTIDFGLGESVSRFLTKFNVENTKDKAKDFLGIIFKLYLIIDALIILALLCIYVFSGIIFAELTPLELEKFRVVFIIAALFSIGSFPFQPLNGILISNERFIFIKSLDVLHRVISIITLTVVLLLGFRLYALVFINAVSGFITIGFKIRYILKNKLIEINYKVKSYNLVKEVFSFSIWVAVIVFAQRFIFTITPTVLAAFSGSSQIAIFSVASMIEGYVWLIASSLNGMFLPRISNILVNEDALINVEALMIKVGRIQFLVVGLLFVGFLTLGRDFVELWLGKEFHSVYGITVLILIPTLITLTQQIANTTLIAKNLVKYHAYGVVIMSVTSIIISLFLSPRLGALGAGIGIFIGTFLGGVIFMNIIYSRLLKINILVFFRECHMKIMIPFTITIILGFSIQQLIHEMSWTTFFLKVTLITLFYVLLVWKLSLNSFEKSLFLSLLTKKK